MYKVVQRKKQSGNSNTQSPLLQLLHQCLPNSEIQTENSSPATKMDGRDEAARWINLALKLLVNRDLVGTKSFAIRAKEADPTMGYAEEILAVVDTLMAAQQQVNGRYDWYGILRVEWMCRDTEVIASEYRRLALLLNPQRNGLPFAEEAFNLVNEAWSVLSNPLRKSLYDNELSWLDGGSGSGVRVHQVQQHQFLPMQSQSQVQPQQQPQVVTPVRVQQQYQHVQQQAPYQPQFQPRPQPQMQFEQLTQQARVQSHPVSQPQVQSLQQQRVQSPPVTQPQAQRQSQVQSLQQQRVQSPPVSQPQAQHQSQQRVQSQQVIQPHAQRPSQPQVHSRPVTQPQPQGHPHLQQQHHQQTLQEPIPVQVDSNPLMWKTPVRNMEEEELEVEVEVEEVETDPVEVDENEVLTFWTACPYCYHLFEHLKEYEDCTLRCQNKNCRRAFYGSAIAPPPESKSDKKASFCSWGFFPVGASPVYLNSGKKESGKHSWQPFSPMFTCPMEPSKGVAPVDPSSWNRAQGIAPNSWNRTRPTPKPRPVIVDDDDYVLMELSDSADDSDTDWGSNSTRKKKRGRPPKVQKSPVRKSARRGVVEKSKSGTSEAGDHVVGNDGSTLDTFSNDGVGDASAANALSTKTGLKGNGNLSKKVSGKNPKDLGKLDLNVELDNEAEEIMSTKTSTNGAETSTGAEENIEAEGIGFFEGLDEFLNNLPILSAVGDDKVKAA